jgi:hypothetical protein
MSQHCLCCAPEKAPTLYQRYRSSCQQTAIIGHTFCADTEYVSGFQTPGGGNAGSPGVEGSASQSIQEGAPLPGIPTTWALNQSVPEVRAGPGACFQEPHHLLSHYIGVTL